MSSKATKEEVIQQVKQVCGRDSIGLHLRMWCYVAGILREEARPCYFELVEWLTLDRES